MKKIIKIILCIISCISFSACSSQIENEKVVGEKIEEKSVEEKKALVLYFSQSGHTETVANYIQKETNADIIQIQTKVPYPNNLDELYQIGQNELDQNARPELLNDTIELSDYDIIFLGYPIWGGTCPMAIFTLLEQNDFSNTVIAPFCTHGGSGLANSISDLEEQLPENSTVLEGFSVNGNDVKDAYQNVENWLQDIDDE